MKLSLSAGELLAQLQTVTRVASSRSAVQALSGVMIAADGDSQVELRATDMEIGLRVPASGTAHTMDEARTVVDEIGLPIIVRPAYILGGRGTGIASTPARSARSSSRSPSPAGRSSSWR